MLGAIRDRLAQCGLELNLQKTRIVYCKDANRPESHEHEKFTFLGHDFRPRRARNRRGEYFASFLPAISEAATKEIREEIRRWKLPRRSEKSIDDLARMFNPKIRGWVQFYGRYYRSRLNRALAPLDHLLVWWACRKYKKLRGHRTRGYQWLSRMLRRAPALWAHWEVRAKVKVA
jgi:RNA-directed DNA polymerase